VVFGSPLFEPIRHGSCVEGVDGKEQATVVSKSASDDLRRHAGAIAV
jgi:hypothetical protein